ncbi:MAG TPA: lasso peptide biosynthesis B2 protein [Trichocoleus sp.]|jgi:hypothetical protein
MDKHTRVHQVQRYSLNQNVILLEQATSTLLLDLYKGKFFALNSTSAIMLTLALKHDIEDVASQLSQIYDASEKQIQNDLVSLLCDLKRKDLIVLEKVHSLTLLQKLRIQLLSSFNRARSAVVERFTIQPTSLHSPSRLTYYILLTLSWLSFRLLGWLDTIKLWQHWHSVAEIIESPQSEEIIHTVDQTIRQTASQHFLAIACKERALVGYCILRGVYRLPAILILGVDHHPFQLHMWVECNGKIVTDDAAHCAAFTPIAQY